MTEEELKIIEVMWHGHPIRLIDQDVGAFVTVGDIAKVTGMRRRSYLNFMDKNSDVFSKHERMVSLSTPGGSQKTRCIDLAGAYTLLQRITACNIKNDDTRKNIIEFREWMESKATRKTEPPALPAPVEKELKKTDFDHIWAELQFVKRLAKETGWDLNELRIAALRDHNLYGLAMVGEKSKPAEPPLALPAPAPKPKVKDYMTATDIGELCGMSAQQINKFLYNNHYIIKDDAYDWRMTELGREYGEERVLEPSTGILVITGFWKPSILEKMNINHQEKIG